MSFIRRASAPFNFTITSSGHFFASASSSFSVAPETGADVVEGTDFIVVSVAVVVDVVVADFAVAATAAVPFGVVLISDGVADAITASF